MSDNDSMNNIVEADNSSNNDVSKFTKSYNFPRKSSSPNLPVVGLVIGSPIALWNGFMSLIMIGGGALSDGAGIVLFFLIQMLFGIGLVSASLVFLKRHKRYLRYISILGDKSWCLIEDFEASMRFKHDYIVKDLNLMIKKGMFPEARILKDESRIFMTRSSYEAFEAHSDTELLTKTSEVVLEGREMIREIKMANVDIKDIEVSEKVTRMEAIINQIIDHIESHPEEEGKVRKIYIYYIPTVLKLLNTYSGIDNQKIDNDELSKSKQEIKDSLDNVNVGFEKFYESLFSGVSIDISSEISVLNTMLSNDGLQKSEFE